MERGVKPRLGQLSSETTGARRFTRQMAEPRVHPAHRQTVPRP
jgi:hypothetical protein